MSYVRSCVSWDGRLAYFNVRRRKRRICMIERSSENNCSAADPRRMEIPLPKRRFVLAGHEKDQKEIVALRSPLQSFRQGRRLLCREQCLVWQRNQLMVNLCSGGSALTPKYSICVPGFGNAPFKQTQPAIFPV